MSMADLPGGTDVSVYFPMSQFFIITDIEEFFCINNLSVIL